MAVGEEDEQSLDLNALAFGQEALHPTRTQIDEPESFCANGSNLLGRNGAWNCGSTASERRYLRMVFRDNPVRRDISRIGIRSRKDQRRITLNKSMSITP